jgi:hypothetical protein
MNHVTCYKLHVDEGELSRLLFGRAGRLRLVRWILANVEVGGFFYQSQAREGTGDVPNEVRENLRNLELLGLIQVSHRDPGPGRRQYYKRLNSSMWAIFDQALRLTDNGRVARSKRSRSGR